jgi:N-methylhydantoinase A/oxoprolinase/acetone carboxylase beta subunit
VSGGYRVAIDIGGTFTDVAVVDDSGAVRSTAKVLSTPADPSTGFFEALDLAVSQAGLDVADCRGFLHATTVATNAVLTRTGGPAALIATEGFRDVLEIARQIRHDLYDLRTTKPEPLVPRQWALEVRERLLHDGSVVTALDAGSVRAVAARLRESGIRSVAVCLLHAYLNPSHERRVREILVEEIPGVSVSLSSDIAPEVREYPRASTTTANAYVRPVVAAYIERIGAGLADRGATSGLWLMKSNGGLATAEHTLERPVEIIESGPAAGLAAAAHHAARLGSADVVTFDMGGTTAKVGMIERGESRQTATFEIASGAGSGSSVAHASGLPILGSVVDLVEIGAGGGSLAWIDAGGILRVGPRSAGADPGPACYGRGGTEPTVTDANVVLGRIGASSIAGGRVPLDAGAAEAAIGRLAARLGVSTAEAAVAIIDVADSAMVQANRLMTVRRGLDPERFDLIAFGGAGPLHACSQATALGFRSVIVPPGAGVLSAFGLLASAPRVDTRIAFRRRLDAVTGEELAASLAALEADAIDRLPPAARDGELRRDRAADMRYVGQSWDLRIPIPDGPVDGAAVARLRRDFDATHEQAYGYASPESPIETVHLAISVSAPRPLAGGPSSEASTSPGSVATPAGSRRAYVDPVNGWVDVPVYALESRRAGDRMAGPALIDGADSTTFVSAAFDGNVQAGGLLHLLPRPAR